ncbi:MFS transporter [Intrasporangium sp. YIM S08009]|uniref:MFS transporter n=1 Tax=Intrasporangium zincisolvens TaxID=3080018 RepID=UPI002B05672E|nr:MFS transporter [Intrasporangium sp. YIM S08009]
MERNGDRPVDGAPDAGGRPRRAATGPRAVTRGIGRGIGRAAGGTARFTARGGRFAAAKAHAYTHSGGAGESGLARLTELHASHTAGDTIMTLALAGILFFNPATAQARSQVAMFLLVTMVPFALVAPLIGPLLDRFRHGRRWAIGTTTALRAFLCWVLADAVTSGSVWLFPAALGCLVASRAYTITRAAAVPRLLPSGTTLVRANSRVSMAGVAGALAGGALGGIAMLAGPAWALRVAFAVFVFGTVQAIRLPARVDSAAGEADPEDTVPIRAGRLHSGATGASDASGVLTVDSSGPLGRFRRRKRAIPWPVMDALWTTGGTRVLTGFLILFMAFLTKEHPVGDVSGPVVLGVLAAAIGIGNVLGTVLGDRVRDQRPERVAMVSVLVATVCCVLVGIWYGPWTLALLGLAQGLSAQLSKLCFDALVQRDVPEHVRTSVFGWSETMLQMLWVLGGALGIVLPLDPRIGFPVCAAAVAWTVVVAARQKRVAARYAPAPRTPRPHRA